MVLINLNAYIVLIKSQTKLLFRAPCGIQGLGFGALGLGFRVEGVRVQGLGWKSKWTTN